MLAATASFINATNGSNGDNPTDLNRADIDQVIRTLAGNNAYTISDNIEGEDRFGKMRAEVKFSLIDLEAYGESYGDKAEEQYLLAA